MYVKNDKGKIEVKCDECGKIVDELDEIVEDIGCGYVCCYVCSVIKEGLKNYEKEVVGYNYVVRKRGRLVDEDGFEFEEM